MIMINPQIFIMAAITLILAWVGWGILFYRIGIQNRMLIRITILMLPMSALVNLLIKTPVNHFVASFFHLSPEVNVSQPVWYLVFLSFLPPITEELAKAFPLAMPEIRKTMKQDALWVGAWSGLGFGLGEIIYLAWTISVSLQYQGTAWYSYTGFLGERLAVCLVHAMITGIFFYFIQKGQAISGYLIAVFLHLAVNAGAILLALGLIKPWVTSLSLMIMVVFLVLLFENARKQWELSRQQSGVSTDVVYFSRKMHEKE